MTQPKHMAKKISAKLTRLLNSRHFDRPKTAAMYKFLEKESPWRVVGLSIEPDGIFIYTNSTEWQDDAGAGTFREDTETEAIKQFYERVQPGPDVADSYKEKVLQKRAHAAMMSAKAQGARARQRSKNPVKKKTRKGNPERITQAWLEKRADLINDMLKRPKTAYTETATGLKPNGGHFYIDYAYGGVGLEQMSAGGGAHAISGGHEPKKELNNFLNGFIEGIRATQDKRPRNPAKRKANPRAYSKKAAEKVSAFRRKSRAASNTHKRNMWLIFKVSKAGVLYLGVPTVGRSMYRPNKNEAEMFYSKASAKAIADAAVRVLTAKGSVIGITQYSTTEKDIRKSFEGKV